MSDALLSHPIQACISIGDSVVFASGSRLTAFSGSAPTPTGTSCHHTALIRYLAAASHPTLGDVVVSTGEDKTLALHKVPSLELVGSFVLNKRANAIAVGLDNHHQVIVVGDKFGDVYKYPLDLSAITTEETKVGPLLGHVSMLTSLALVPATDGQRALIATGDRDEHIRVARFPNGHNIERFLFGSTKFVSALGYVPATATTPPTIVSGGGDPSLSSFNLSTGEQIASIPVESLLLAHVVVAPLPPAPVPQAKTKADKRRDKLAAAALVAAAGLQAEGTTASGANTPALEKGEAEAASGDVYEVVEEDAQDVEPEEGEELDGDEGEIREAEGGLTAEEAFVRREYGMHAWKDGKTTGLAVDRVLVVDGGVLVTASGCTTLLFVPTAALFAPSSATSPADTSAIAALNLSHPILSLHPHPASSSSTFLATVDLSRGPSTASTPAVREVRLFDRKLQLAGPDEQPALASWAAAAATPYSKELAKPTVESLYPILSLIHHPDESYIEDRPFDAPSFAHAGAAGGASDGFGVSKRAAKRARKEAKADGAAEDGAEADEQAQGQGLPKRRNGQRAAGRAEIQRRLEEAKRRKEEADKKGDSGEVVAVEATESAPAVVVTEE